jgi:agmatine deiminase
MLDSRVTIVERKLDDLWARDTLPVFTIENGKLMANIFNFNGWGNKQKHLNDAKLAESVAEYYGFESKVAKIIAEGGSFETDGKGTLLVTESSLVNTNRNSESKEDIEAELKRVLGVRKVIWFKGVKNRDITDAHVDCLVRFVKPGTVILNRSFPGQKPDVWSISSDDALNVLQSSTDADGKHFEIIEIVEPNPDKIIIKGNPDTFLSSYVNFLIANKCVIVPAFGDTDADLKAQSTLQQLFPGRTIVPVQISALASGGGGIHCATHEEPAIESIS